MPLAQGAGGDRSVAERPAQPGEPTKSSSGSAVTLGRQLDPSNPPCSQPQNGAPPYTRRRVLPSA